MLLNQPERIAGLSALEVIIGSVIAAIVALGALSLGKQVIVSVSARREELVRFQISHEVLSAVSCENTRNTAVCGAGVEVRDDADNILIQADGSTRILDRQIKAECLSGRVTFYFLPRRPGAEWKPLLPGGLPTCVVS